LIHIALASGVVSAGPVVGMSTLEVMHQRGKTCDAIAGHDEMPMISHDHIGKNLDLGAVKLLSQDS
jgi:hypothetical protein